MKLKNISHLLFLVNSDIQEERLDKLQRDYEEELAIIQEEFDTERGLMIEQHKVEQDDIEDIMFAMDQNFQERESEARAEFESLCDEIKNKVKYKYIFVIQSRYTMYL